MLTVSSENTGVLRGLGLGRDQIYSDSGRHSDIRPGEIAGDDTETTFVFNVPARDPSEVPVEPPGGVPEPFGEGDGDGFEDVVQVVDHTELEESFLSEKEVDNDNRDITAEVDTGAGEKQRKRKKKAMLSKHGIKYTSMPPGVVKKLATTFARTGGMSKAKINKETLDAIMQASNWFFEQVSDDLSAYSQHGGRKTIDESDILTLMTRYFFLGV
jgi:histone H3/H4